MRRTEWLEECWQVRFVEAYEEWQEKWPRQEEAARLWRVHEPMFRRDIDRDEERGLEGLLNRPLEQVSHRRAPMGEVMRLTELYRGGTRCGA
ncbi:MAG: hypothetical protein JNL84_11435 [Candidatus Accumulibacter sp.]|nr:hypothetical protein [Accumulibacter sp.]